MGHIKSCSSLKLTGLLLASRWGLQPQALFIQYLVEFTALGRGGEVISTSLVGFKRGLNKFLGNSSISDHLTQMTKWGFHVPRQNNCTAKIIFTLMIQLYHTALIIQLYDLKTMS